MTATRGRKRRPADASARTTAAKPAAPPDTRLPLRHTPNGYQMRHVDNGGEERLSVRTWAKGSARGDGPQQQRGTVEAAALAPWVPCEDCGSARPADAAGRHGAMPVRGVVVAAAQSWPTCRHGVPYWEQCRGRPVLPPCCLGEAP